MNRDEFKFDVKKMSNHDESAKFYNKAIDVAFDYFESRTCSNCKYSEFGTDADSNIIFCSILEVYVRKSFGCNKFEGIIK